MHGIDQAGKDGCFAACLASIFDVGLDAVPNFPLLVTGEEWFELLVTWLRPSGLSAMFVSKGPIVPNGLCIEIVTNPYMARKHAIVVKSGEFVWDPSGFKRDRERDETVGWVVFTVLDPSSKVVPR